MNIKESLVRQSVDDKIYIGGVVQRAYNGKFGDVLRAYIEGVKTKELLYNQEDSDISAERRLGRCEAYTNVIIDLERMIEEAQELQQPIIEEEEDEHQGV